MKEKESKLIVLEDSLGGPVEFKPKCLSNAIHVAAGTDGKVPTASPLTTLGYVMAFFFFLVSVLFI